jgi:crotonobetainyl-CoA:carnitine CoA-transferase CaiB-like acyl-CoA transferase
LFRALAGALGHPEWIDDPRFTDNPSRVAHQAALYAMLDAQMLTRPSAHWIAVLEVAGVPCAQVNNLAEMMAHPQAQALGLVQDVPGTGMRFIGLPMSFNGQRTQPRSAPPRLGEHNDLLNRSTPT